MGKGRNTSKGMEIVYEDKWLLKQLKKAGAADARNVFLLTVAEDGSVVCILKEDAK